MNFKIIDLFSGAGGLSTGASQVPGVEVIACVNHDEVAIKSHKANHPKTLHFTEDVRDMKVIEHLTALVKSMRKKDPETKIVLWASLECTNFSKAKGVLPREADSRTLANYLDYYIEAFSPDAMWIENVEEFMAWGELDENGKPISKKKGTDYVAWIQRIQAYGYQFDYRLLNSADFGAYTSRRRYFAQFVKHGFPVAWPEPTHCKKGSTDLFGKLKPWKAVKHVLDFSDKGQSIFTRKKPLSENTLKRIYAGLIKYVANGDTSFLKQYNGGGTDQRVLSIDRPATSISTNNRHALVQPDFMIQYNGKSTANSVNQPCNTIPTKDRFQLVWLDKQFTGSNNHQPVSRPAGAVLGNDKHALVSAFLMNPQFNSNGSSIDKPCFTLIARMDKKPPYLVQVDTGEVAIAVYKTDSPTMILIKQFMAAYGISDIYMRMLKIPELLRIQGFPEDYVLLGTQTQQKKFIGNAVEVTMGKSLISAQMIAFDEIIVQSHSMVG